MQYSQNNNKTITHLLQKANNRRSEGMLTVSWTLRLLNLRQAACPDLAFTFISLTHRT